VSKAIELAGLEKSFKTGDTTVNAVAGVDLSLASGETVALLGPNGAGKTTTIDLILGLLEPDAGTVELFGVSPHDAVSAGRVGGMLQTGSLLRELTVRELLTMMASLYPRPIPVDDAIALAGVGHIAERRTEKLSGGETQRARFALALVSDPDFLVLDEPTVALDVEARRTFWATMREVASRGKTVLFATHYLEEADAYADRVVLMAHGRIVADGAPTEIKAMVGARRIRATLPMASVPGLESLPGVTRAERHGETVILVCADSDATIRALLARFPEARDIEITGAGLEDAFLELTVDGEEEAA
jgi:ABC-2 type transport system ATP-binding protein